MTTLDGILIVVMLVSALLAMIRGLSREILSICSWIVAGVVAWYAHKPVANIIAPMMPETLPPIVADVAGGLIVFIVTLLVVGYAASILADKIVDSRIGALDRTLGFIFGAARGLILVAVTLAGFMWVANNNAPVWIKQAKSRPMLTNLATTLYEAVPQEIQQRIIDVINQDQNDNQN